MSKRPKINYGNFFTKNVFAAIQKRRNVLLHWKMDPENTQYKLDKIKKLPAVFMV